MNWGRSITSDWFQNGGKWRGMAVVEACRWGPRYQAALTGGIETRKRSPQGLKPQLGWGAPYVGAEAPTP